MHPVYLSRRRQRRGRSETAYQVKQIFRFLPFFSFSFSSFFSHLYSIHCIERYPHQRTQPMYILRSLSRWPQNENEHSRCAIFSMWSAWMELTGTKHKREKHSSGLLLLCRVARLRVVSPPLSASMAPCPCHMILNNHRRRSSFNIEMQSLHRRLWLLVDPIRRWAYVYVYDWQVFASNDDADKTDDKHQPIDCAHLR